MLAELVTGMSIHETIPESVSNVRAPIDAFCTVVSPLE